MKRNLLVASLGALAMGALFSMSASAQTCAGPFSWQPPAAGNTISGDTCGQDTTAAGYCAGNFDAPGPAYVIQSTFDGTRTFGTINLNGGGAGFDPVIYMTAVAGGCGTNAACGPTGDSTVDVQTGDVPDGDWFIVVTAASINGAGACGTFDLISDGSFPVSLQEFSVM